MACKFKQLTRLNFCILFQRTYFSYIKKYEYNNSISYCTHVRQTRDGKWCFIYIHAHTHVYMYIPQTHIYNYICLKFFSKFF